MSFEMWLFAIKKFAQSYEVAQLLFENLSEEAKADLRREYEEYIHGN